MPIQVGDSDSKRYMPTQAYSCELIIKDKDYSEELNSVQFVSSIISAWPIIYLELFLSPDDAILDHIYGQEPLKLKIMLRAEDSLVSEDVDLELMYLNSSFDLPMKERPSVSIQTDRVPIQISTVCRQVFKSLTTIVNEVYQAKTVKQVIEDLVGKTGAKLEYDSDGENTETIDQILIPPTTLYKAIGYLDKTFGLFDGVPVVYSQYDNKLYVKNLTKKMSKGQIFTIYQLTGGDEANIENIEKSLDGITFYTYTPINTSYSGNSVFSTFAKTLNHVVKPRDTLYHTIEHDLATICSDNGLIFQNKDVPFDTNIEERTRYYINHCGYEKTESFAKTMIAKKIAGLSTLSLSVERDLKFLSLINVGETVKFDTNSQEYLDLTGKYILKSSMFNIMKSGQKEWGATCHLNLIRTNKTI